jgi:hypothetical protein
MSKANPIHHGENGPLIGHMIICPACGNGHAFYNGVPVDGKPRPAWSFNGDRERPTFAPSMLVRGTVPLTDDEVARVFAGEKIEPKPLVCHSYVRDGQIQFLSDCTHEMAGKTVDLPDF